MDELLREFLTETNESLDVIDVELVRFEQDPNNAKILDNIFRLVHTIKGTCGFLGLPRLQALAHSAETLMGRFRDGVAVTAEAVTLVLATIDRIKQILAEIERTEREPEGLDRDLIGMLERLAAGEAAGARFIARALIPSRPPKVKDREFALPSPFPASTPGTAREPTTASPTARQGAAPGTVFRRPPSLDPWACPSWSLRREPGGGFWAVGVLGFGVTASLACRR
jgi:two-component system chemotaxis sensor kinase CheA